MESGDALNKREKAQAKFHVEKAIHTYCQFSASNVESPTLSFSYDCNKQWTQIASIDGAVPKFIPITIDLTALYFLLYTRLAENHASLGIYDTMQRKM